MFRMSLVATVCIYAIVSTPLLSQSSKWRCTFSTKTESEPVGLLNTTCVSAEFSYSKLPFQGYLSPLLIAKNDTVRLLFVGLSSDVVLSNLEMPPIGADTETNTARFGCDRSEFDEVAELSDAGQFSLSPPILVVWRGVCSFLAKAQVAMAVGASGLVIINNEAGIEAFPMAGTGWNRQ